MKSTVSVIIAAYHGERYIGEQLRSLFSQTRVPDEILIGDDSDDDATFQAVEAVRGQYSGKLRYIRNPQRLGFKSNFIDLARAAGGDLIFFCDQDDVWHPEKIEVLSRVLENDPDCQVAACDSEMADPELRPLRPSVLSAVPDLQRKTGEINSGQGLSHTLSLSLTFAGHNLAMKRSFLPYFLQIPEAYDYHDCWLTHIACFLGVLRFEDRVLTRYRVHGGNASSPWPGNEGKSLSVRFRELRSPRDILYIAGLLRSFSGLVEKNYPDRPNRKILEGYARYFCWRESLIRKPLWLRLLSILRHPLRLRDHFRCGHGFRSMARDLLARTEPAGGADTDRMCPPSGSNT